jgi:hypothetical protein
VCAGNIWLRAILCSSLPICLLHTRWTKLSLTLTKPRLQGLNNCSSLSFKAAIKDILRLLLKGFGFKMSKGSQVPAPPHKVRAILALSIVIPSPMSPICTSKFLRLSVLHYMRMTFLHPGVRTCMIYVWSLPNFKRLSGKFLDTQNSAELDTSNPETPKEMIEPHLKRDKAEFVKRSRKFAS